MYKKEKQLFQRDPHPEIRFPGRGSGELPMMAYAGGLHPKGVRIFLEPALRYMKGYGFH